MPKQDKDLGHEAADNEIKRLEKKFTKIYSQAYKEVKAKLDDYLKKFQAEEDYKKRVLLKAGDITQAEYQKWYQTKVFAGKQWQARLDAIAGDMVHTNEMAYAAVNHALPTVYAENYNFAAYQINGQVGMSMSWQLVDRSTVERLVKDNPDLLPAPSVDIPKDQRWNRQKITSAITQGIIQGEPITKISKRLENVVGMNATSAVRAARTAVTNAECAGRYDTYRAAKKMGIDLNVEWIATLDNRTRHTHAILDGQKREVDEPFEVDGVSILFPGGASTIKANDKYKVGELIYNCRCTIAANVKGYEKYDTEEVYAKYGNGALGNESYDEWKERHRKAIEAEGTKGLTKGAESDTIKSRSSDARLMAHGGRLERSYILNDDDIKNVKSEAEAIQIPTDVLRFNQGWQTGFSDKKQIINIRGDVFPDNMSTDNRDILSVRAVLAHEYYGHYKSYPSKFDQGTWQDEFSASYNAALNAPNLSIEDRARLMIDAFDRAKAAGISVKYNKKAREIIYGKQEDDK